jgi:hypothetical protein
MGQIASMSFTRSNVCGALAKFAIAAWREHGATVYRVRARESVPDESGALS